MELENVSNVVEIKLVSISEDELKVLREKANLYDLKKKTSRDYFQANTKQQVRHCTVCDADYKMASFSNHVHSKSHFRKLAEIEEKCIRLADIVDKEIAEEKQEKLKDDAKIVITSYNIERWIPESLLQYETK